MAAGAVKVIVRTEHAQLLTQVSRGRCPPGRQPVSQASREVQTLTEHLLRDSTLHGLLQAFCDSVLILGLWGKHDDDLLGSEPKVSLPPLVEGEGTRKSIKWFPHLSVHPGGRASV